MAERAEALVHDMDQRMALGRQRGAGHDESVAPGGAQRGGDARGERAVLRVGIAEKPHRDLPPQPLDARRRERDALVGPCAEQAGRRLDCDEPRCRPRGTPARPVAREPQCARAVAERIGAERQHEARTLDMR